MASAAATLADAGSRISLWIYLAALPATAKASFVQLQTSGGTARVRLYLTTAGVLQLWNAATAQIGTDGATLSTGQWYRISLAYTITSTTINRFELFVNGVSSISITNATLSNTGTDTLGIGNWDTNTGLDFRSSDHYVDNSSALTDPGNIWVTAKRPNANGSANAFTTQIGAGGSGYGSGHSPQVNERALSTTNGWSLSNTTLATEEYSIENRSTGDIDITGATIVDFMGWMYAVIASTSNSPVQKIIVAGTGTTKTLAVTNAMYTQIAGSSTYPAGNTDIGMSSQYTTTPHLASLFECGIIMAFIPVNAYTLTTTVGAFVLSGIATTFTKALHLILSVGTFVLTGISVGLSKGRTLVASVGTFVLTGIATNFIKALLTGINVTFTVLRNYTLSAITAIYTFIGNSIIIRGNGSWKWIKQSKNSSSYSNQTRHTSSYSKQSKNSSSWTDQTKN